MKTKEIILLIFIMSALISCISKDTVITGYVVCKEYVPEHMDNENPKTIQYNIIIVPHYTPHRRTPQKVLEGWYLYVANKNEVFKKRVNKTIFDNTKITDKVTFYKYR